MIGRTKLSILSLTHNGQNPTTIIAASYDDKRRQNLILANRRNKWNIYENNIYYKYYNIYEQNQE